MATTSMKAGRTWTVEANEKGDAGVVKELTRPYVVFDGNRSAVVAQNGEAAQIGSVPAIGSTHPSDTKLVVDKVDYSEGKDGERVVVTASVHYTRKESDNTDEGLITDWGWDSSTSDVDLVVDKSEDAKPVLNSAGDPFDSAPKIAAPTPTFTKVVAFSQRKSGWNDYCSCVNDANVEIGGITFAPCTLLCSVSETRQIGEIKNKYKYTITLRYRSNVVKLAGDDETTECGWDATVVDTGMRALVPDPDPEGEGEVLRLVRVIDKETGKECTTSKPVLLDGNGHTISPTDEDQDARIIRYQAYRRETFPSWFYDEPSDPEEPETDTE